MIFAVISMLGFGFSNSLSPIIVRKLGEKEALLLRNMFTSLFILIILLFSFDFKINIFYLVLTILFSIFGFIPLYTFFKAQKIEKIGIVNPIANSSLLFTVIFSIILFDEKLNLNQSIAISIILIGVILTSLNLKNFNNIKKIFSKGISYAIVTSLLWGLFFSIIKISVDNIGPIMTAFIVEFVIFLIALFWVNVSGFKTKKPSANDFILSILISFLGVLGILFYNFAVTHSPVSIVSAISFSSPFIGVIFARAYLKEKLTKIQYFSVSLIILGIILLSYLS